MIATQKKKQIIFAHNQSFLDFFLDTSTKKRNASLRRKFLQNNIHLGIKITKKKGQTNVGEFLSLEFRVVWVHYQKKGKMEYQSLFDIEFHFQKVIFFSVEGKKMGAPKNTCWEYKKFTCVFSKFWHNKNIVFLKMQKTFLCAKGNIAGIADGCLCFGGLHWR